MTNKDAALLVEMVKRMRKNTIEIPAKGNKAYYKADGLAMARKFTIQVYVGKANRPKHQVSLLYRKTQMLMRIDTGSAGCHYNDDGTTIPPYAPHLHMYDESCAHENKCHNAILLPEHFKNPNDCIRLMEDFLKSINVVDVEHLQIFQQGGLDYE